MLYLFVFLHISRIKHRWIPIKLLLYTMADKYYFTSLVFSFFPLGLKTSSVQFSSVQSLSHVRLFATPWIAALQASLSITSSRSSLTLTSIKSVMPSSHLILCRPLLLLPPIPPSIGVFSNESTLHMRWPKYWSFRWHRPLFFIWCAVIELLSYQWQLI